MSDDELRTPERGLRCRGVLHAIARWLAVDPRRVCRYATMTTVAGIPVNPPTHGHGHGYTDISFLIPELVVPTP